MTNYQSLYKISQEYEVSILKVFPIWDLYCMKLFNKKIEKGLARRLINDEEIEKRALELTNRYARRFLK